MIAILKIDSADVINRMDSEKFQLRMIPSTKIKFDSEEMKFYEPIFFDDVDMVEEPDPSEYISREQIPDYYWDYIQNCISNNSFPTQDQLNPNNYLFKSDMPIFYWNFSKYALTKPLNISPSNYSNLCNILQAVPRLYTDNQIYNFATQTPNIFSRSFSPSITAAPFYTDTAMSIYGQTKQLNTIKMASNYYIMSNTYFNFSTTKKLEIHAILRPISSTCQITSFYPLTNSTATYLWGQVKIIKTGSKYNSLFTIRKDSTSGGVAGITLEAAEETFQTYYGIKANLYTDDTTTATLESEIDRIYIIDTNAYTSQKVTSQKITIPKSKLPNTNFSERLGTFQHKKPGESTISSVTGEKNLLYYSLSIDNKPVTIIKPSDAKILSENLMVIV